ncbi:MAG TPA: alanine racemase [Alphaproteobacteria bacterium]
MASDAAEGYPSQPILTIDLGAVVANYRTLCARLTHARCAAVVKADAYGLGAARIAPALAAAGCRDFFVAHLGEAIALRQVLPADRRIYVLNGLLPGEADEFRRHDLVPVLNDAGQVKDWAFVGHRAGQRLPAALHLDTGMSRLGLAPDEARWLATESGVIEQLDLQLVMSHLACAEEPEHPLNRRQLQEFTSLLRLFGNRAASFANSSGIFLGPSYHFDLVRPGCALYGINPVPGRPNPVMPVAHLHAPVLQVREIDHPQTVGYGATHRATTRTRVATVAAGYADGWLRTLSNRGSAYVGDIRVPIIGRVSMDLITIDVSSVPDIRIGQTVELMGSRLPVDDVASLAGTIGYEVLTRLGPRFQRRYINEPTPAGA